MPAHSFKYLPVFILLGACQPGGDAVRPHVRPLIEAVYASGFVVAEDEYQVFAQVDGAVVAKMVRDGDSVNAGDLLYIIESGQQSARLRVAKENYELAARNVQENSPVLEERQAALRASRAKMRFDSINYMRYENLLRQNATTRVEFDRMKLQYENSKADFAAQQSRYKNIKDQLRIEQQNALGQLQISGDESSRYQVRSEVNGTVFKTTKEKGELVRRSEALAVVGRSDTFYLQLNVDELDIQRVKPGQPVQVKIDAFPGKIFRATVAKVFPFVNKQQQSLRVDATFDEALPAGFSGLAVEANIIIRQKEKAIVIPRAALLPGDSVMIESDNGPRKIGITKGIETLDEVEVIAGLDTTQQIIVIN